MWKDLLTGEYSSESVLKIFNQCIVFSFKPLIIAHFPVTLETVNISGGRWTLLDQISHYLALSFKIQISCCCSL